MPTKDQLNFSTTTAPTMYTVAPADYMFDFDLDPTLVWYSNHWRNTYYDTWKMSFVAEATSQRLRKDKNGGHLCYYFSDKFETKIWHLIVNFQS